MPGYRRLNRWGIRRLLDGDRSAYYQQLSYRMAGQLRPAERRVETLQRSNDELRDQLQRSEVELQAQWQRFQAAEASTVATPSCDGCQTLRSVVVRLQQECDRHAGAWMRLDWLMAQRPYRCCWSNTSGAPTSYSSYNR